MPPSALRITPTAQELFDFRGDALILPLIEEGEPLRGPLKKIDEILLGAIARTLRRKVFRGKPSERYLLHPSTRLSVQQLLLIGLGKASELTPDRIRQATAEALRQLLTLKSRRVAIALDHIDWGHLAGETIAQTITEGALLGLHRFDSYKHEERGNGDREVESLTLLCSDRETVRSLKRAIGRGETLARATNLARDLINEPANVLTPTELAARARDVARRYGLAAEVLDRDAMRRLGMGALLGVAQGSANPPRLIILRHRGGDDHAQPALGLVGKGVTFDAGGISIKASEGMETMKGDMAGAAAVIGAMMGIAALRLPIHAVGVIPAVENLPSGSAQRPGDIVRAMDGTTIEVINTDAEGRLILSDALCYTRRLGARRLVDVATLTGGVVVALGSVRTGFFSNDRTLAQQVQGAGEATGEKLWELPLDDEYEELIKSDCADLKNTGGGKKAPAIGAARFLKHFVGDTPWVHLDINGTWLQEKAQGYQPKGATGVMVRTLIHLAATLASGRAR
ncbi:MAG: leucyl aminopeptidase [candidate division NC10 bacterium]|nr:leucyl aminopeptidase [candidate division NC10 bacterium]